MDGLDTRVVHILELQDPHMRSKQFNAIIDDMLGPYSGSLNLFRMSDARFTAFLDYIVSQGRYPLLRYFMSNLPEQFASTAGERVNDAALNWVRICEEQGNKNALMVMLHDLGLDGKVIASAKKALQRLQARDDAKELSQRLERKSQSKEHPIAPQARTRPKSRP